MVHPDLKFWRAVGTMIGGIVGVGVFGLPFAFSRSGFAIGAIELVAMALLLSVLYLMFAEIALQTGGDDRLVGYVRRYLGRRAAVLALAISVFTFWGAMLAYIIVGGQFLHGLVSPMLGGPVWPYSLALAAVVSLSVHRGLQAMARTELYVVIGLLFLFAFAILASLPHVRLENVLTVHAASAFAPYGVILFALSGLSVIPEMRDILGSRAKGQLPRAVTLAMSTIAVLYALFAFAVLGATGSSTTETAFEGLSGLLGPVFSVVFVLLGTLTVSSVYSVAGIELTNIFAFDWRLRRRHAWALAMLVPIGLYLVGVTGFISVVGFVGGVLSAVLGFLIVLTYERMRRSPVCHDAKCFAVPHWVSGLVMLVLFFGALGELSALFGLLRL
jgi:amino acid permease